MRPRRGPALVLTFAVLAGVATGTTAALAAPAKSTTICVALVVDGRALGSDVSTSCAKVPKGATGVDVLEAGGHRVGFRHDGLVCTIDGLPKTGCAAVDDTHYWAYFHRAPGATSWTYSSEGPSTYQPVNDSTEGWVYDDGTPLTPENVPYAQICKPAKSPTPKPTVTATPRATPTPRATTAAPTSTPRTSAAAPAPHHTTATPAPTKTSAGSAKPSPQEAIAASASASSSPAPSTTSAALAGAVPPATPQHHGWLDLLIGVVVIAALGVAATLRFRRSAR